MGRTAVKIDKTQLEQIIKDCESKRQYKNWSELFKEVANQYTINTGMEISPSLVYLRVNEWGMTIVTPKGKRGRQKGEGSPIVGTRRTRSEKFSENDLQSLSLLEKDVRKEQRGRFLPLVEKLKRGSLKAAIKLACLNCSNYQPVEIKYCPCSSCPLHAIRPYKATVSN